MSNELRKPVIRKPSRQRSGVLAALDIGSSKIACFIAENNGSTGPVIKGIGQYASAGMRSGEVVNIEALSVAIGKSVEAAEIMAGLPIDRVSVSVSGGAQKSIIRRHLTDVAEGVVSERDIARVLRQDMETSAGEGRVALHRVPLQYMLDGVKGIREPLGMRGRSLAVDLAVVTAAESTLANLTTVVERNHLEVDCFGASSYVSALSSLVEDEKDLGATIIDMGAGVTGIAIFMEGSLVYVDQVPIGGNHVTSDIARGLSTPVEEAERIKTLHGSVLAAIGDTDQLLTLPLIGEKTRETAQQVELGLLGEIIRPRIEETFEMLLKRLEAAGFGAAAGQRVILTGGAAQLPGITEFVSTLFGRAVRIGKPIGLVGMADATRGPSFSTTAGLLRYTSVEHASEPKFESLRETRTGMFGRIGEWFNNHI